MKQQLFFHAEADYRRFVLGKFHDDHFATQMLAEFGTLWRDSPQITTFYRYDQWTIIPAPATLMTRGVFLDLMSWLSQADEEAFAVAFHQDGGYYARRDWRNPRGDSVFVALEKGPLLRWYLPQGLARDDAYTILAPPEGEQSNLPHPGSCRGFLSFIGAGQLIAHLDC